MPHEILITGGHVVTLDDTLGDGPAVLTGISLQHTPADITTTR